MPDKVFKQLRIIYILSIIVLLTAFVADVLYTTKYMQQPIENVTLERWSIILSLFGIFASLKLLHPKLKESDKKDSDAAIKKYASKYYLRLLILAGICIFNIACLHFTGVKNFMFLAFITIFAVFLCAPNKQPIEKEINDRNV